MKKIEDLKNELIEGKVDKFYVFYGDDYGLRKHYINKISTYFNEKPVYTDDYKKVNNTAKVSTLFGETNELVVIYEDVEFAKLSVANIQDFIDSLVNYFCIFVYEEPLNDTNLFKNFQDYITNFPTVQPNIAKEFVDSELSLSNESAEILAKDCDNNYNNILLESNKIKVYAQANNLSDQNAYESLVIKNQIINKMDSFNASDFMDDILLNNIKNFSYWYIIAKNDIDKFFNSLTYMFNDYLIAYLIKQYGKWDGGNIAYNYRLSWGRVKTIREYKIPYDVDYLYACAYRLSCIDANVKMGKLEKDKIVDYFFDTVI